MRTRKQYQYQNTFADTEYTLIVVESDSAKETIAKKLERVIIGDASLCVFSEGEDTE